MLQEIFDEILEAADFHSIPVELAYGDGGIAVTPAITLEELRLILCEILDAKEVDA